MKETPPIPMPAEMTRKPGAAASRAPVRETEVNVNYGHGSSYTFANDRFEAHKLTMALFAANLERFADRQIVDMTGLTAQYDFAFDVLMPEVTAPCYFDSRFGSR